MLPFRLCPAILVVWPAAPIKIFGDLHGQFGDLMRLFEEYGTPSTAGDITYIDYLVRGAGRELWGEFCHQECTCFTQETAGRALLEA